MAFLVISAGFFRLGWRVFFLFGGVLGRALALAEWGRGGQGSCLWGNKESLCRGRNSVAGTSRDISSLLTSPSSSITSCLTSYAILGYDFLKCKYGTAQYKYGTSTRVQALVQGPARGR